MKFLGIILTSLALVSFSPAQSSSAKHVRVSVKTPANPVKSGETFKAEVTLTIADGWHINSNTPKQEYMIGTSLTVDTTEGFAMAQVVYPKEQTVKLSISETPLRVYSGTVGITVTFATSANVAKGKVVLKGTLRLQACNDQICVAPSTIPVELPVTIES